MLVKYSYILDLSPDKRVYSHYASFPEKSSCDFIRRSLSELCSSTDCTFISFKIVTENLIVF